MVSFRRLGVVVASLSLLPLGVVALSGATPGLPATGAASAVGSITAPSVQPQERKRRPSYDATIRVTKHGIPHITGKNFGDLGFGSGYAAAGASICTLADTLVTGRGQRSRWFGPDGNYNDQVTLNASNLQVDAFVTDLHNRKVVEKLLADKVRGPGKQARRMVRGYAAGVNKWLKKVGGPKGVSDPECHGAPHLKQRARADRPLVRRLPRQHARIERGLRQGDRRRRLRPARATPACLSRSPRRSTATSCSPASARTRSHRSARTPPRSAATPRPPARACCSATRTSRGAVATTSPSSSSRFPASTTSPVPR